jgi:hypothetical protein
MTASMVHIPSRVTNLTPESDNPTRVYGPIHQLMTASIPNLTPPGSECSPTDGGEALEQVFDDLSGLIEGDVEIAGEAAAAAAALAGVAQEREEATEDP